MATNYELARDWLSMCVYGIRYKGISIKQQSVIRNRLKQASREIGVKAR